MPPLKIALLGHGTNTIPPKGWGAVESLIWEYSQGCEALGHTVSIVNTLDNDYIVSYLNATTWDVIHMHDDSLINLVPDLNHKGRIVVTSHYPAIHDRSVWNDVSTGYNFETVVIAPLLHYMKQNEQIVIGALCSKDRDAFLAMGVPVNRVFLMVNGASAKDIVCDGRPTNGKAICLGQVCERKRQRALVGIPSIEFWGPCLDEEFKRLSAYKGEMTAEQRNKTLTEYEVLVLLSTAEASPLVLKEALFAGLGLVLSETVATELPASPWISVVPERDIGNKALIAQLVEEQRAYSVPRKQEIRASAVALWDWPQLIQQYVVNLQQPKSS
jgi:hypothetical protein